MYFMWNRTPIRRPVFVLIRGSTQPISNDTSNGKNSSGSVSICREVISYQCPLPPPSDALTEDEPEDTVPLLLEVEESQSSQSTDVTPQPDISNSSHGPHQQPQPQYGPHQQPQPTIWSSPATPATIWSSPTTAATIWSTNRNRNMVLTNRNRNMVLHQQPQPQYGPHQQRASQTLHQAGHISRGGKNR